MFDRVLVGVDGRAGGDDAITLARALAAPGARVTLAQIYGNATWPAGAAELYLDDQRDEAQAALDEAARGWPGAATACRCAPTVGRGLHELAEERAADLLAVGSSHRGLPGRVLVGDDTRGAFNGAPCALAIAPRDYAVAERALRRIAVGYHGTPECVHALAAAREIARRTGAAVTATWVVTREDVRDAASLPVDWPLASDILVDEAQHQLDQLPDVEGVALAGGPREELRRLADDVDLLVVGSRGYGPLGRLFHGSVSSYLERHVSSPLLIVPRATDRESSDDLASGEAELAV